MPSDRGMFWNNIHSYNGMQYRYILVASMPFGQARTMLSTTLRWSLPLLTVLLGMCSVVFWTYNAFWDPAGLSIEG